ncbi:MAG: hypothetical protein NXH74_04200 [Rhodobacteraceae bacterium]|nr:hypothetical protein [Paracoccaceae bacterium]
MKALKEIIITYLAIWGFVLIVPFFMMFIAIVAILTQFFLRSLGFDEEVVSGGMLAATFISIWALSNIYSSVRFKRMEHNAERNNENSK